MPKAFRSLFNRAALMTLIWATLQQIVVAASTYFIVVTIRHATEGDYEASMRFALAFVISLIVVFVPNTLSVIWLQRWRLRSMAKFIGAFVEQNGGRATFAHSREKAKYESWVTNESSIIFDNSTRTLYDIYQIFLSTILNVGVIALAIDPRLFVWYLVAGLTLMLSNWLCRGMIAEAALTMQNSRRDLSNTMLSAWDNIFVGNAYNLRNWLGRFHSKLQSAEDTSVRYDATRTLVSSLAVTFALLIIATGNWRFLSEHKGDVSALAALLVTLPRQLQIVQNIFSFFSLLLSWQGVRTQLLELNQTLSLGDQTKDPAQFIRAGEIAVFHKGQEGQHSNIKSLKDHLLGAKNGRFTLRGKNGAGKSTLIAWIAESTGVSSFYLPSHFSELSFADQGMASHSDGNRVLAVFNEPEAFEGVRYILLDEWDANLDTENIRQIDAAIDRLAEKWTVIESRHRA